MSELKVKVAVFSSVLIGIVIAIAFLNHDVDVFGQNYEFSPSDCKDLNCKGSCMTSTLTLTSNGKTTTYCVIFGGTPLSKNSYRTCFFDSSDESNYCNQTGTFNSNCELMQYWACGEMSGDTCSYSEDCQDKCENSEKNDGTRYNPTLPSCSQSTK